MASLQEWDHILIVKAVQPLDHKRQLIIPVLCGRVLTFKKKSVKLKPPTPERLLEAFYAAILRNSLDKIHLPHSDVFYARAAIEANTGIRCTLAYTEKILQEEGLI